MEEEHREYVVRVANTDLVGAKILRIALQKVRGVGQMVAHAVCHISGIDSHKKTGLLTDAEVKKIERILENPEGIPEWMLNRRNDYETGESGHKITTKLLVAVDDDLKRLKRVKTNRGMRHARGLPTRGQRTGSNFRRSKRKNSQSKKRR